MFRSEWVYVSLRGQKEEAARRTQQRGFLGTHAERGAHWREGRDNTGALRLFLVCRLFYLELHLWQEDVLRSSGRRSRFPTATRRQFLRNVPSRRPPFGCVMGNDALYLREKNEQSSKELTYVIGGSGKAEANGARNTKLVFWKIPVKHRNRTMRGIVRDWSDTYLERPRHSCSALRSTSQRSVSRCWAKIEKNTPTKF